MTTKKVRLSLFTILVMIWITVFFIVNQNHAIDDCIVAYSMDMVVAVLCFVFYVWWWIKSGLPSTIYFAITVLFSGISFTVFIQGYARYLYIYDQAYWTGFLDSNLWAWRTFPKYMAMSYMLSVIMARVIIGKGDEE